MKTDALIERQNMFDQWRTSRKNTAEKTPQKLRNLAISLLTQYPSAKITTILRISGSNLKKWRKEITTETPQFIELSPATSVAPTTNYHLDLLLKLSDNRQLTLSGNISPALLTALVEGLTL